MESAAVRRMVLIPAGRQVLWGAPAVVNFACGGLGAGLYLVAAVAADFQAASSLAVAAWLGPALVFAGFAAVATEAGRPLRGARVLRRAGTSWMSRELWLGGAFAALALLEFVAPGSWQRLLAALAAAALVLAQGLILRRARGMAAWEVPFIPLLFLVSAALSGAGLHLLVVQASDLPVRPALVGLPALLALGAVAWLVYLHASREADFVEAVRPLREGRLALALVVTAYLVPALLIGLALAVPAAASVAAPLAALAVVAGQFQAKWALIVHAGQLRPITLLTRSTGRRAP